MNIPPFIDAVFAADMLHVSKDTVIDLVREGKLRKVSGQDSNPFVRTSEVAALAEQMGAAAAEQPGRRIKSASAKVRARLTADARWADVSEAEIRDWAARLDPAARAAARTAVRTTVARLSMLLQVLDDVPS